MTDSISVGVLSVAASCAFGVVLSAVLQERDRAKIPDRYKWDLTRHLSHRRRVAGGEGRSWSPPMPRMREFKGTLATSAGPARRRARALEPTYEGAVARVRLRQHEVGRGHPRQHLPGHAAGDGAARAPTLGAETAFIEPEILKMEPATIDEVRRAGAAAQGLQRLPRRHPAPAAAHRHRCRGEAARRAPAVLANGPSTHLRHPLGRRFPLPDGHAQRRQEREARQRGVQRLSRRRRTATIAQKVMSAFFTALGQYKATFGATLNAQVQSDVFYARARKYDSALAGGARRRRTSRRRSTCA